MNLLVCTLGASWAVVPEVFGFVAPATLDLYAHHPEQQRLDALREEHGLNPPDEVWLCTTGGVQTERSLARVREWWHLIGAPIPLRTWIAEGTDQLASQSECEHLRELTCRVVLHASERLSPTGQLILSLAGGRKTMSADLQSAGQLFGAHAWLHVVGPDPLPEEIARGATPHRFAAPLPAHLAGAITPMVVGRGNRSDLLDVKLDGFAVRGQRFPLPLAPTAPADDLAPQTTAVLRWPLPSDPAALLTRELDRRERESSRLLGNFLADLGASEHHENWRALYRLPPREIQRLRETPLRGCDEGWLDTLPKADLHRHLGGCLDLPAQIGVARAVWDATDPNGQARALDAVQPLLELAKQRLPWPLDWPEQYAGKQLDGTDRALRCAALLTQCEAAALEQNLYEITAPRIALKTRSPLGFAAYERPGELTGSAILTHPAALAPYAEALVAQARAEGLVYVELRGSPHKYRQHDPASFVDDLRLALQRAGALVTASQDSSPPAAPGAEPTGGGAPRFAFIWIIDRRQRGSIGQVVDHAVRAQARHDDFLVGLDLAGDEGTHAPEVLAGHFLPAFRNCLRMTIHAGEGEAAENIWQAAYHLHADRIGHGLSLAEHPRLRARFRDRDLCIELCPTSNREVVGFRDPAIAESSELPTYPLRTFIDHGVPVAICTDNPGISRTTVSRELITAARMGGSLSHWEALALIKQGFTHAFVSAAERETMLKQADQQLYRHLSERPAPDPAPPS